MEKTNIIKNKNKLYSIIKWVLLFFVIVYAGNFLLFAVFAELGYGSVSTMERLIYYIPLVIYIFFLLRKIITGSKYLIWVLFIIFCFYFTFFIIARNDLKREEQDISATNSIYSMREEAKLLYDDTSGYSNVCEQALSEDGRLYAAKEANNAQNYFCNDSVEAWAAGVVLTRGDGDELYCADSTGTAGQSSYLLYMLNSSSTECIMHAP